MDATNLVDQAYKGTKDSHGCKRLGTVLEDIRKKYSRVDKASVSSLVRSVREGPTIYMAPKADPGEVMLVWFQIALPLDWRFWSERYVPRSPQPVLKKNQWKRRNGLS